MICRYCGHRIVWKEGEGWVHTDENRMPVPRTWQCDKRPEADGGPDAGHRLPPDPRFPDQE